MASKIILKSKGDMQAFALEEEIIKLKDKYEKQGVDLCREEGPVLFRAFVESGAGQLIVGIGIRIAANIIYGFFKDLIDKRKKLPDVTINIEINQYNAKFELPATADEAIELYNKLENEDD
jgi:hypothetical protein